ncbi:MAG: hypothetical protein Q9O74_05435 [Planctomycetota bacterium]|nr:hypothetical protein [Planctomycetota bacterium]
MPRTVVLRHHLPDGTHHYDWFIEPVGSRAPLAATGPDDNPDDDPDDDPDARVLIAWRLAAWPIPAGSSVPAERLPPHRRLYLDYEGPISGNRGTVRQVAAGIASISADTPDRFEAVVNTDDVVCRLSAIPHDGDVWHLTHAPF